MDDGVSECISLHLCSSNVIEGRPHAKNRFILITLSNEHIIWLDVCSAIDSKERFLIYKQTFLFLFEFVLSFSVMFLQSNNISFDINE